MSANRASKTAVPLEPQNRFALREADSQLRARLFRRGVRFLPSQERMIRAYLDTGHLSVVGGRGSGKSYALAYLCAVELVAGSSVVFRSGVGDSYWAARCFRENVSLFLTPGDTHEAEASGRLWLPLSKFDYAGRSARADFRDEVWTGAYFHRVHADRVAQVGSLPENTIILPEPDEPPAVRAFGEQSARAARPVEDAADQCFRVGAG